jgi:hypothetical protein
MAQASSSDTELVGALADRVRGELVHREHPDYEQARRVDNGSIDRHPELIVRCVDAADVIAALDVGREAGLDIAVRGGGHSVPGFGTVDDGLVLDLSPIRNVRVDPDARLADVGGGATFEDGDLVFCHADGRPFDSRGVSLRFVRLAKAAGLPTIRLHDLRHGVATMGLGAEVHAEVIRRRLGHRDIATTLDTYTHGATEVERAAATKIAALVDRI